MIIDGYGTITNTTPDEELEKIKSAIESDADGDGVLLEGLEKFLEKERDNCKENKEEAKCIS